MHPPLGGPGDGRVAEAPQRAGGGEDGVKGADLDDLRRGLLAGSRRRHHRPGGRPPRRDHGVEDGGHSHHRAPHGGGQAALRVRHPGHPRQRHARAAHDPPARPRGDGLQRALRRGCDRPPGLPDRAPPPRPPGGAAGRRLRAVRPRRHPGRGGGRGIPRGGGAGAPADSHELVQRRRRRLGDGLRRGAARRAGDVRAIGSRVVEPSAGAQRTRDVRRGGVQAEPPPDALLREGGDAEGADLHEGGGGPAAPQAGGQGERPAGADPPLGPGALLRPRAGGGADPHHQGGGPEDGLPRGGQGPLRGTPRPLRRLRRERRAEAPDIRRRLHDGGPAGDPRERRALRGRLPPLHRALRHGPVAGDPR
mmetsp:Transcript_27248/g.71954  ORF Transcript_27248/g.71954 Transcript_27248/m.71954 type:complete len:364 (-) Transcript_27248:325-1416(-)